MSERPLVIYHAHCVDGFTAAWCAWLVLSDAEYVAASYGDPPPDVTGRQVYILDFSYPVDVLREIEEKAKSLVLLDHHKTAFEELEAWSTRPTRRPTTHVRIDLDKSGSRLAHDFFMLDGRDFGLVTRRLVEYVEDRDLWRWSLEDSRTINALIGATPRTFSDWSELATSLSENHGACLLAGLACLSLVEQAAASAVKRAIWTDRVPTVNCTFAISETGHKLLEAFPSAPFVALWFQREDGRYQYSLRSRAEFDVSEVAKRLGGGGHKNAAGFTVDALWEHPIQ